MHQMLDHDERCRYVVNLLALVNADVDTLLSAALAQAFGFGQSMMDRATLQVGRQPSTAVGPGTPLGFGWTFCRYGFDWRWSGFDWRWSEVAEQIQLVGIEAFGTAAVETMEQSSHAVL
jgi:hypothetical protein